LVIGKFSLGIVGFTHIQGQWTWDIIVVKGKHCYNIPVIYPIYKIVHWLWSKKLLKKR